MSNYETPAIIELGSVADFTRGDNLALDFDGQFLRRRHILGGSGSYS